MRLLNPNSSGQGYSPDHTSHVYHQRIIAFGWGYSHSTRVKMLTQRYYLHHTYKLGDWNLSVEVSQDNVVHDVRSSGDGSGTDFKIETHNFDKYMKRKTAEIARRYPTSMRFEKGID